ncbi:MAG: tRNA lysidine(34) synthetase TilS [candidate division Zixibacteria bacterium]|nr:tRNA lysidine(34) synthetase TilS [candidate division Zixibacteria bacterium]
MRKLLTKIESSNRRYKLFAKNDKILIALSGGPDSIALFHLLDYLTPKYSLSLSAAHIDHSLRPESAEERQFCRLLCRAHGVSFHSKKLNIKTLAKRQKMSLELTSRQCRYAYFQQLCEKHGYTKIATGHTADDSAETIMLNLVRGAHLAGLGGIPPRRENIIRPLIEINKSAILDFLKKYGLSCRLDLSNLENDYSRNIIRNKVFPVLKKINPQAMRNISRAGQNISDSMKVIEDKVRELYDRHLVSESNKQITLDLRKLPDYYKSLESWIILRAYSLLTGELRHPDSERLMQAANLSRSGAVAFLNDGVIAVNNSGRIILSRPPVKIVRISLRKGETVKLGETDLTIKSEILDDFSFDDIRNNKDESTAYLDNAKLGGLTVRSLIKGDRFKPLGFDGTKKAADYLNDKGVPGKFKSAIPIVASGRDIVWVAGYGIADKAKVTRKTRQVLKLKLLSER